MPLSLTVLYCRKLFLDNPNLYHKMVRTSVCSRELLFEFLNTFFFIFYFPENGVPKESTPVIIKASKDRKQYNQKVSGSLGNWLGIEYMLFVVPSCVVCLCLLVPLSKYFMGIIQFVKINLSKLFTLTLFAL